MCLCDHCDGGTVADRSYSYTCHGINASVYVPNAPSSRSQGYQWCLYLGKKITYHVYLYVIFFLHIKKCLLDGRQILTVEKQELSTFLKFYSTLFCSFKLFLIKN